MKSKKSKNNSSDYATLQQPNGSWLVYRVVQEGSQQQVYPQLGTAAWTEEQAIKIAKESFNLKNKVDINASNK